MSNNIKNVFGQHVDLDDYKNLDTTTSNDNGAHSHYGWLPLSNLDAFDVDANIGIRADQQLGRAADDFLHELKSTGWNTKLRPPAVDVATGKVKDGRKREWCFIFGKQEFMPVEFKIYQDASVATDVAAGLLGNMHEVTTDHAKPEDLFVGFKRLLEKGEIEQTEKAAYEFMSKNLKGRPYQKFDKNNIKKQVKRFLALNLDGTKFMKTLDRGPAEAYVKEALRGTVSEFALYTATGTTNVARALVDHILPNAVSGKHTNLVLYIQSTPTDPVEVTKAMQSFKSNLDIKLAQCGDLVEGALQGITLSEKPFAPNCYTILGAIPQKEQDLNHKRLWNARELINLSDY